MKKLLSLIMISFVVLASCGDDSKEDDGKGKSGSEEVEADFSGMNEVSLDTFGLDLSVMVPEYPGPMNTTLAHNMTELNEGFQWKISIGEEGQKYSLIIEDITGVEDEYGIDAKKSELAGYKWITVTYEIDQPDLILFEKVYDDESMEPHYHVMGIVKTDNATYKLYSEEGVRFTKPKAEKMLMSIKSVQGKDKPA